MKKYLVYLMGAAYVLAGINHFYNPSFYFKVMPTWLPAHLTLIYISGVAEILLGAGLWFNVTRRISAWLIVAMLIVFIPLHVDMIINPRPMPDVPTSKLAMVNAILWLRVALQFLFIYWAWVYTKEEK
jgi:uncharacterized membrane protein